MEHIPKNIPHISRPPRGFTLIELLITIAIIGILAGIVVVSLSGETEQADDAAVILSVQSLRPPANAQALSRGTVTGTAICNTIHEKVKGGDDHLDTWTGTAVCTGNQADTAGEICCASDEREWVVWGRLNSHNGTATHTDGVGDYHCIDDDGHVGDIDIITAAETATGAAVVGGTFVAGPLSATGSTDLKCQ